MTILSPRRFIAASSGSGSFPAGGVLTGGSFREDDVVDQADAANADRGGEDGWVEGRDLDVVDVDAVQQAPRLGGVAGGERARQLGCEEALLAREQSVSGREREAVLVAHGVDDAELELQVEVPDHPAHDLHLLRVLLPEVDRVRTDDVEELAADGGDGPEVPRPELALEGRAQLGDLDPGLEALGVHLLDRWREQEVDACVGEEAGVARLVTRVAGEVCGLAELSRVHEQAGDDEIAIITRGAQEREMASVERAHGRDEPDPRRAAGRLERPRASPRSCVASSRRTRLRQRPVERLELGRPLPDRGHVRVHRRPVAAGDRAGELEAVLDRARHQRHEPGRRRAGKLQQGGRGPLERDQVAAREHRSRVVEDAPFVGELERLQPEGSGEPEAALPRLLCLGGDGPEGAVELLRAAPLDERLQGVDGEAPLVWVERGERGRAADMADPGAGLDALRDLCNRAVRDAEDEQLGVVLEQAQATLA